MDLVILGIIAGVIGTLAMDSLNLFFARIGTISKVDVGMIGRMAVGWTRGRFFYGHPGELKQVRNEKLYGYIAHYAIGICLAVLYVLGWVLFIGGPVSPTCAIPYGIATAVASWFFVYPSIGFGIFGKRSPEGIRATFSSLANHLFFGIGMVVGIALF